MIFSLQAYDPLIAIVKRFSRYGTCSTNLNPPSPPFSKGGT